MNSQAPLRRNNTKSSSTRNSIIAAAEALVIEHGISALTLDDIASQCGITVQTIYNRVGGRSAILIAIAEKALEENRYYMKEAYDRDGTPPQRLLAVIEGYFRFATEKPYAFRLMANPPEDPKALNKITQLVQKHNRQLEEVIEDGIQAGMIDAGIDAASAATALWAAANGLLALNWRADRDAMTGNDLQGVLNTGIQLVMSGLFLQHG
ncbi:MAG: TetR family transcriptional regulator [Oceanospirillaceae bacterium]|nr:TetR family transcriptional regulator [Oceanospirillaceae bacterium]MBT13927.1 TetR family transcriptional regulator [Oceanospirillaceae bacterium]|tara:strand:- start:15158 stop:15784 length:627 start_codon:yes stop_codon:yes gene_type:complete